MHCTAAAKVLSLYCSSRAGTSTPLSLSQVFGTIHPRLLSRSPSWHVYRVQGLRGEGACLACSVEMTPVATWRTALMVSDTSNTASLSSWEARGRGEGPTAPPPHPESPSTFPWKHSAIAQPTPSEKSALRVHRTESGTSVGPPPVSARALRTASWCTCRWAPPCPASPPPTPSLVPVSPCCRCLEAP